MVRITNAALLAATALVLSAAAPATAIPPGALSALGSVVDNDAPADQSRCAQSTDGISSIEDVAVSPDGRNVYAASRADGPDGCVASARRAAAAWRCASPQPRRGA